MKNKRRCKHCKKFFDYRHVGKHEKECAKNPKVAQVIQGEIVDLPEVSYVNALYDSIWRVFTPVQKQRAIVGFILNALGD